MTRGMYRLKDPKTGRERPTWYVRRDNPEDVRARLGGRSAFVQTTGETDHRKAAMVADRLWRQWGIEIDEARALGTGPTATLDAVTNAVENWRRDQCAAAAGLPAGRSLAATLQEVGDWPMAPGMGSVLAHLSRSSTVYPSAASTVAPPSVERDAVVWARSYFTAHPTASRAVEVPHVVGLLLGRLQAVASNPEGWVFIPDFDARLDAAVAAGGGVGAVLTSVREKVRQRFAMAWLEVEQHREAERRRAAAFLSALEAANAAPDSIRMAPRVGAYEAREGDLTVSEAIDAFKLARAQPDTDKQYGHIFRCLKELVGPDKPVRGVTRGDVREIHRFLSTLPANASKIYPDRPSGAPASRSAQV